MNYPDVSTCADRCTACNSCGSGCGCGRVYAAPSGLPWTQAEAAAAAANGFGLLRTVPTSASTAAGSGCWHWQDYPFYSGPCGPTGSDCGCNSCNSCNSGCGCGGNCGNGCYPLPPMPLPPSPQPDPDPVCPANATFIAGSPLNLAAGDSVTLSAISTTTDGFIPTTSGIRILNAGTYMVTYTVQIPAGEPVASRFVLTLDGGNIASSALDVNTAATGENSTAYTMQAFIQASDNSLLNLTTLGAFSLTTTGAANAVTLSILQIC